MRDLLKISSVTPPRAEGKETTLATRVFASSTALLYLHAAPCGGNLETYIVASEALCRVDDSQMNGGPWSRKNQEEPTKIISKKTEILRPSPEMKVESSKSR